MHEKVQGCLSSLFSTASFLVRRLQRWTLPGSTLSTVAAALGIFVGPNRRLGFLNASTYIGPMRWRNSYGVRPAPGFIGPCLPSIGKRVPSGSDWVYELKMDGYRLMVRKAGTDVRVYSRNGADFTARYPRLVEAARRLRATSALIDGEGVVFGPNGMPSFDLIHSKEWDRDVSLVAFDLLQKDGEDLRPLPLLQRKQRLAHLLEPIRSGIEYQHHLEGEGSDVFRAACKLGHEGIVAKRKDLAYESGRSRRWIKIKNPDSPAAIRVEEGSF